MSNANEIDVLKQELRMVNALLEQTKGKLIAVERDSYETKRQAKLAQDLAAAQEQETQNALLEASNQMKIALGISQGVYALGQMGRNYCARKAATCRVVHREGQMLIVMQQLLEAVQTHNPTALASATEKAKAMIDTVTKDGEANRAQAIQAMFAFGFTNFEKLFDQLIEERNQL